MDGKMKVLLKAEAGPGFVMGEKDIPQVADHEVLMKIKTASVCGTDLHIWKWDKWSQNRIKPPVTVGHEFSGEVIAMGKDVTTHKIGDIVAAETHIVCNKCDICKGGNAHVCPETEIIGVDIDGAFAEYIAMPAENARIQSKDINPKYLSVLEPLGNAVHTMTQFDVKGLNTVIVGAGPIGLMGVNLAKNLGAKKVIVLEVNEYRRKLSLELGADVVIDPTSEDVIARVLEETGGLGADMVGEFSGNKTAIEQIFKFTNKNAKVSMLGLPPENISLNFSDDIVLRGLSIYGVAGRKMYKTWEIVEDLIAQGKVDFEKIVTHEFAFDDFQDAFELMASGNSGKIVLKVSD